MKTTSMDSHTAVTDKNVQSSRGRSWKVWTVAWQVAFLWGLSGAGNWVAARSHSPIPGSILAFAALFLLLEFKLVKLEWISSGADWLLANLLLWFIPAAVGIVQYGHLVQTDGLRLILVIGISITMVMAITGVITDLIARRLKGSTAPHSVQQVEVDS